MKFFAVLASVLSAAAGEASLPIAAHHLSTAGLYSGYHGIAAPYAAAYGQEARFAYGAPVTALNAGPLTAGPVAEAPVAAAIPALAATAPVIGAQYAAAYAAPAIAAPAIATAAYAAPAIAAPAYAAPAIAAPAYAAPAIAAPAYAAPVAAAAPVVAAAPVAATTSSQFQAQDEFGNLAYGYQNVNSAKQERGNTYGGVEGSYTYTDEAGVHTVHYVADDLGFRVVGDNLPVAPVHTAVAPVYTGAAPVAVVDTPEVAEAKAAFHAAYAAEASRTKRAAQYPAGFVAPAPIAPVAAAAYAAPAAPSREAVLTTIKLNPGHAVFYRVD